MAYVPTNWKSGDVVTSAKLNNIEQGIVAASGLVSITIDGATGTLDKTGNDIEAMVAAGALPYLVLPGENMVLVLLSYSSTADGYSATFGNMIVDPPMDFSAADADTPLALTIGGGSDNPGSGQS